MEKFTTSKGSQRKSFVREAITKVTLCKSKLFGRQRLDKLKRAPKRLIQTTVL